MQIKPTKKYPSKTYPSTAQILSRHGDHAFDVKLPNGKISIGFLSKSLSEQKNDILPESTVSVLCSPADMDCVRIVSIITNQQ